MSTSSVGTSGSMIDVNGIVSKLMTIEQRPLDVINKRVNSTQVSISAMSQLRASVDAAASAAASMQDMSMLAGKSATSSVPETAAVTLTDVGWASAGTYNFELLKFASSQRTAFFGFADPTAARGLEQVRLYNANASSPIGTFDVTLDFSGASLNDIRDAINDNDALKGKVVATVVQSWKSDGTIDTSAGYKLLISGASTGVDAAFSAEWNLVDSDGSANQLAPKLDNGAQVFDRDGVTELGVNDGGRYGAMAASNAVAEVDGIKFGSPTNVFTEAIAGVRIEAFRATTSSTSAKVSVTVQNNRDELKKRAQTFASAVSDLQRLVGQLIKPGTPNTPAGPLAGNSAVLGISAAISSSYSQGFKLASDPSTTYSWSKLGFDRNRDGSVSLNASTLTSVLADSSAFAANFFTGFSSSIESVLKGFRGVGGSIDSGIQTMQVQLSALNSRKTEAQARLERTRQSLVAKYSKLDSDLVSANQRANNIRGSLASVGR
jgi:flagellar hook-associated protein 2